MSVRIRGVGTANPPNRYTQEEVAERYRIDDPRIAALFRTGHIHTRHLYLPPPGPDGAPVETQGELLDKHLRGALELGPAAIDRALEAAGLGRDDIHHLVAITTTGFLAPGLSAHLVRAMGLSTAVHRLDVVGMGCNAGLNGLQPAALWADAHAGRAVVVACIEVCSAAYVVDGTLRSGIVNSLFGDGAAAAVLVGGEAEGAAILDFESEMIPSAIDAMRYDWDDEAGKFSFFLDPDIPYVVGEHVPRPVGRLLARNGLKRRDVAHWVVHSGGKKVVDAVKYNLGLTAHDVRHTTAVLRDFGNLSSGSFLFSLERLQAEGTVAAGDLGVMMTMGPGSQIETALVRW